MSCPCKYTTPCNERCTCVNPVSSYGCNRCCSYGSDEQRKEMAELIAYKLDQYKDEEDNMYDEGMCGMP